MAYSEFNREKTSTRHKKIALVVSIRLYVIERRDRQ